MTPQFEGVRAFIEHAGAKYRACVVGNMSAAFPANPDSPEFGTLLKGNSDDLMEVMRKDNNRNLRDAKPKLWDEMVEEQEGLVETMRQAGVHVIRNEKCDTPDGLVNMHDGWKGNKHMSVYGGPSFGRIARNIYFNTWDNSATGTSELHHRPGTLKLFEQNPDLIYYSIPYPEPNFTVPGWGMLFQDVTGWRTMPNKHVLFGRARR